MKKIVVTPDGNHDHFEIG